MNKKRFWKLTFVFTSDGSVTDTGWEATVECSSFFQIPPTPESGSTFCLTDGDNVTFDLKASDPLGTVSLDVGIVDPHSDTDPTPPFSQGGFAFATSIPMTITDAINGQIINADCASTTIDWTVTSADWGIYEIEYLATNANLVTQSLIHTYFVDAAPSFVTPVPTAPVNASINQPFSYTIVATDSDIIFGDAINFADPSKPYVTIPNWASLTDNMDGTVTISGTPTVLGDYTVSVEVHDRQSHFIHTHCNWDFFDFTISVVDDCNPNIPIILESQTIKVNR